MVFEVTPDSVAASTLVTGEVIPFAELYVAILGGTGAWACGVAMGEIFDPGYRDRSRLFAALPEAQEYAQVLADELEVRVKLRPAQIAFGPSDAA